MRLRMLRAPAPLASVDVPGPGAGMVEPRAPEAAAPSYELLLAVLEGAEHGVVACDGAGRAVYMNAAARAMVGSPGGAMPAWLAAAVPALRYQLARGGRACERVVHEELTLRVQARMLARPGLLLLELGVAAGSAGREVVERLERGLGVDAGDARLLALLWRGLSNEEIAAALGVRTGTIKSRLFRLYQRLGVKRRPAAVLRAQEALAA